MLSETDLQNDLKKIIRNNIEGYLKLQQTSKNATTRAVRDVLWKKARKKATLIRELTAAFHRYNKVEPEGNGGSLTNQPNRYIEEVKTFPLVSLA